MLFFDIVGREPARIACAGGCNNDEVGTRGTHSTELCVCWLRAGGVVRGKQESRTSRVYSKPPPRVLLLLHLNILPLAAA